MNDLHTCLENLKNDKRLQDWNLKTGKLTPDELKKMTDNLEDLTAMTAPVDIEDSSTDSMDN